MPIPELFLLSASKEQRLRSTIRWASFWLMLHGLLYLLPSTYWAGRIGLRYEPTFHPQAISAGMGLLWMGYFVLRTVRRPETQFLAVDFVLLFFLLRPALALRHRVQGWSMNGFEWALVGADLAFALLLLLNRTSSKQMQDGEALLSLHYKEFLKTLAQRAGDLRPQDIQALWGSSQKKAEAVRASEPPKRESRSKALPHMD